MALFRTGLYVKNHSVEKVQVAKTPIASYNGNVTGLYIPEIIAEIVAKQSGSGTPAPDNIRPIIGVSECNVVRCGVNVWDEEWENGTFNTTTGANINNTIVNVQIRSKNFIPILHNVQYRFTTPSGAGWFIFFDTDGNVINNPNVTRSSGTSVSGNSVAINNNVIFTVNEPNVRYTRFYMTSTYPSTYNNDISINYPSTDTDYHAYTGNTYTIQLGDTYYGGSLDVTTGELMVTWKKFQYSVVQYYGTYGKYNKPIYYMDISDYATEPIKVISKANQGGHIISNMFKEVSTATTVDMLDNEIRTQDGTPPTRFYFRADGFADLAAVNDFLANNPLQVVALLATPITVQLTPTQIEQFLVNNVWADTGDVEVKFYNVVR